MGFRFELSVALKYLIPRRKQLSVSLIALLSVGVISLVVWLVLVFLSVTEGIERSWLTRLTTLNAPLRITPTHHYYSSWYYQIDSLSAASQFSEKTIGEKRISPSSDPFNPEEDGELPARFPLPDYDENHTLKDPVKGLFALLKDLESSHRGLKYQDFELSGALMRLQLLRPGNGVRDDSQGYLTQASYLSSLPDQCPGFPSLLLSPTEKEMNHLLFMASHATEYARQDAPQLTSRTPEEIAEARIRELLEHIHIERLKSRGTFWQMPLSLLPDSRVFEGQAHFRNGKLQRIDLALSRSAIATGKVNLWKEGGDLFLESSQGQKEKISPFTPLLINGPIEFEVDGADTSNPLLFRVHSFLQEATLRGTLGLEDLEIAKARFRSEEGGQAPWILPGATTVHLPVNPERESGVLLAKSFIDGGVMIGDRGYLSWSSATSGSLQEHRLPIFVYGFYDPGILPVGNKCILVPPAITKTVNASSSSFNLDKTLSNGVLVWFEDLEAAEKIKDQILQGLAAKGLDRYWKVTTFREYDFAKDLMEQFQSDKSLFALVGIIILVVAASNIISMLVLLVNDKKREIGILQAIGASRFSIAAIFGICGITMGVLSSAVGTLAALFTMQHIDFIVQLLSFFQGHNAFNPSFFGKALPDELSSNAVSFILIVTPLISLLAGLVPAIRACRLKPSEILRSE